MKFINKTSTSTLGLFLITIITTGCQTTLQNKKQATANEKLHAPIANPFVHTSPLGKDAKPENFVIRTTVGQTEYTVEIGYHNGRDS